MGWMWSCSGSARLTAARGGVQSWNFHQWPGGVEFLNVCAKLPLGHKYFIKSGRLSKTPPRGPPASPHLPPSLAFYSPCLSNAMHSSLKYSTVSTTHSHSSLPHAEVTVTLLYWVITLTIIKTMCQRGSFLVKCIKKKGKKHQMQ